MHIFVAQLCQSISFQSLHFLEPPYFAIAQYGLLSPYLALRAQYGLLATAIARWAIRLRGRPISSYGLNTGSCRPGLRYAYPGLYSGAPSGRSISPFPNLTSAAGRCQFPRSKPHICLWQMSIPPLHLWRGGQGVRSIPPLHLWRGGQGARSMTGGEVTG